MEKSLEEVMKEYKLSQEEHDAIKNTIFNYYLGDKIPVENPKAIINIAPPASGKTGLNAYGETEFKDRNVVVINSDEIKFYHPKIDEIAKKYPQYYTKVTDQESNTWTSDLFDEALKHGYNVIFEGTGRNARILDTIKEKMKNYEVTVRGMAVNEMNCLISVLERYWGQVDKKGWGRLITLDHFYETYKQMPETIDKIENSGIVDRVQILKRGADPDTPIKIYDSVKKEKNTFPNAKYAILGGREEDKVIAYNYFKAREQKISNKLESKDASEEENKIFDKIMELIKKIEIKKNFERSYE